MRGHIKHGMFTPVKSGAVEVELEETRKESVETRGKTPSWEAGGLLRNEVVMTGQSGFRMHSPLQAWHLEHARGWIVFTQKTRCAKKRRKEEPRASQNAYADKRRSRAEE